MKKIASVVTNYDTATAGFSEGQVKDDSGSGDGSGAVKGWLQEPLYACYALIKSWFPGGAADDNQESETNSNVRDAIEHMVGFQDENVSEFDNAITYAQDAEVMYLGLQYVSMVNSNVGNNPIDNPDVWMLCPNKHNLMYLYQNGKSADSGVHEVHDYRDSNYRQFYKLGTFNFGGENGRNFSFTAVHLDGTVITGDATLEALFDVGGADEYEYLDKFAPDITGTRTLLDAKATTRSYVDVAAGLRNSVGTRQEDKFQGFWLTLANDSTKHLLGQSADLQTAAGTANANYTVPSFANTSVGLDSLVGVPSSDGVNGATRTGLETVMKNFSDGLPFIIVMEEV